jgi:Aspartyl protease
MLFRGGNKAFTTASAKFAEEAIGETSTKVYVRVRLGRDITEIEFMLDTGAAWTMIHRDLADEHGLLRPSSAGVDDVSISTARQGLIHGSLVKCPLTIVADLGSPVQLQATVFCSEGWMGPNILGYQGALQSLRFALDPSRRATLWHFGLMDD